MTSFRFQELKGLPVPGYRRSLLLRRLLATGLLMAAAGSVLYSRFSQDPEILVFAGDTAAGTELAPESVTLRRFPASLIPHSAITDVDEVLGRVVVAAAAEGEPVTEARLLGQHLSEALSGPGSALVPVTVAEADATRLLNHGDTVAIVAVGEGEDSSRVIAHGARVVATGEAASGRPDTILVSLDHESAVAVASASLHLPLAVVLISGVYLDSPN